MRTREERVRRENPHNPVYTQEELDQQAEEHFAHEAYLQESYLEARLERIACLAEERETWREERRNQRVQEWLDSHPGYSVSDYPWGGFRHVG